VAVPNSLPAHWVVPELNGRGNGRYGLLHLLRWRTAETFKADVRDPARAQRRVLDRILRAAVGTQFGANHHLGKVKGYREYRDAVPVRTATAFEGWLNETANGATDVLTTEPIVSFVKTSGTTGKPKYLPVTKHWAKTVREGQLLWTMGMLKEQEAVAHGKVLTTLGSLVEGHTPSGLPFGSNTGRMGAEQPWFVRGRWAVPPAVADIRDPDLRHYVWLRLALSAPVTSWTTANPSMVLALCRQLQQWREPLSADLESGDLSHGPAKSLSPQTRREWRRWLKKRPVPKDWSPMGLWNLAAVNCWTGGPAQYFVDRLPQALGGEVTIRDVGFTASEGYFAMPLHSSWTGGVAHIGGHLLELQPQDGGEVIPVFEAEIGRVYRLILSTTAGLYRYDINDLVEVVGQYERTPVLRFVSKGEDVFSVVGEKVTVEQVSAALVCALPKSYCEEVCVSVEMGEVPRYRLCVSGAGPSEWAAALDVALKSLNVEYASKRQSGRLGKVLIFRLPTGILASVRAKHLRNGAADGQVKDPLLVSHETVQRWLRH
jgi:hypothetical protein